MLMLYFQSLYWLLLHYLFAQFNIQHVASSWLISNSSTIQLLGLFPDKPNASEFESTTISVHSRALFNAALILSHQYNITIDGQFINGQIVQTGGDIINALGDTCRIISFSNIVGIVGPAFSREVLIIAPFAEKIGIPVVSYSATNPDLSIRNVYPNFYRTVSSDNAAGLSIAKLFIKFNWTSCIIIYQNDAFGFGGVTVISEAFSNKGLTITDTLAFETDTFSFRGDLKTILLSSSTRIILLWADVVETSFILQHAINNDVLGPHFLWILSSPIQFDYINKTFYEKLIGILILEPVVGSAVNAPINITLLNAAYDIWQKYESETFPGSLQVNNYALFAFDATWLLIQSLKQLCPININISSSPCISILKSSFCFDYRFLNTSSFIETISSTEFLGISGPVKFFVNATDRVNGTYYLIKNVQSSSTNLTFVSVLEWSNYDEWKMITKENTIVWPGNSTIPPNGLPGLSGIILRIGVIQASPFIMFSNISEQNSTNLIGYIPDLINILKSRMGFIPEIILAPPNQTYNGMIRSVANGIYDIAIGDITITAERRKILDFSSAIFDNSMRIIVRRIASADVNLFSYLKPFSINLWLTVLIACMFAAILVCLLERQENKAFKEKSFISSYSMSIWYSFGTLMGYGADFHAKTAAGRLLSAGLYILSLILVATYTANLASNLTLSKSKTIISGIDDIKNGKIPYSRIGILTDSSNEEYYLREISNGLRNFYTLKTQSDLFTSLLNNIIDAAILDTGNLEYATNRIYCNLTLVGTDFAPSAYGVVVPKQWIFLQTLDIHILSLRELGILDDLRRKWFEGNICTDFISSDAIISIDIDAVSGLFLTFAMICILSLLLFIWTKRISIKNYLYAMVRPKHLSIQENDDRETVSTKV